SADEEPAFTSIAFPYMGYTMMRDGWDQDSLALFFMGSYKTSGHINADVNGVQVVAYGRPLLVYAGVPTYGYEGYLKVAPPNFATYVSEPSSHKINTVLVDGWSQKREEQKAPTSVTGSLWHSSERFDFTQRVYDGGYRKCVPPSNRLEADHSVTHERAVWFVKPAKLWIVADTMRNSGEETRAYSQVWNFPPRVDEEKRPVHGFAEDEVGFDAEARRISTSDPGAPNVHLYHFGVDEITYEKYYGETEPTVIEPAGEGQNPVLGWYARFIADAVPAVDVHATWRGGPGASTLITVIAPSPTETSPVAEANEVPGGFELTLTDGQKIGFAIADETRELTALGVSLQAESLLMHSGEAVTGIALGGESDYEFEVRDGEPVPTQQITAPTGFAWVETPEGIAPEYHPE
ncbi:MAG TPA: heparinase II/III family protein, partial [Armatimonadota bacterium]|nr:heparinase II/III family protein [Armatimonadota bacterium]